MTKPVLGANPMIIAISIRDTAQRFAMLILAACLIAAPLRADETLHGKIDALIAAAHPEGQAAIAGDAEFLRRVYLALHGVIPTATQARAFSPIRRRTNGPGSWTRCSPILSMRNGWRCVST